MIPLDKMKRVEIFCGTGGVGKTTISASRALFLAKNKKVLLITIDPSKRLKQVLGIDESLSGKLNKVELDAESKGHLDCLLLSPKTSFERLIGTENKNNIIETLSKPYGGMNEIAAIIELHYWFNKKEHDFIILDTPPGHHFIDFLEATKKINAFFDKTFADIFIHLGKEKGSKGIIGKLINTGIDKLLSLLESVTGENFVGEFTSAVHILYTNREKFIEAINIDKILLSSENSNWFLVSSLDQLKSKDADDMLHAINNFRKGDSYLVMNKSWAEHLSNWNPQSNGQQMLKEKLESGEREISDISKQNNVSLLKFPEIFSEDPFQQVKELISNWEAPEVTND